MRIFAIFIAIVIIVASFGFIPTLREQVFTFSLGIKGFYFDRKEDITLFVRNYINQAQQIQTMRKQIESLEEDKIKYQALKAEFDNLHYAFDIERHYIDPDVHLVKVISYVTLGRYTKIWIAYTQTIEEPKVFGLIKDGYAIGIARKENNHLLGILNGDQECSYSVYIGENRVPGTLRATDDGGIIVDYIPAWQSIKSGDNVITSGSDGIFFEGVQVGTIGNIKRENAYLRAEIKVDGVNKNLNYIWLIDTKIPQIIRLNQNNINDKSD